MLIIRLNMKKKVNFLNANELVDKLLDGKRVEGVLYVDQDTRELTFKAYNRKAKHGSHDRVLCRLEHGWVKESKERIKVYESVPKDIGMARVCGVIDHEMLTAKEALFNYELDLLEFC